MVNQVNRLWDLRFRQLYLGIFLSSGTIQRYLTEDKLHNVSI
jgi:hypothetical protein